MQRLMRFCRKHLESAHSKFAGAFGVGLGEGLLNIGCESTSFVLAAVLLFLRYESRIGVL